MTSDEITIAVIDALEALGMPYMVVGAIASNYFGVPRSTKDADFVLELGSVSLESLLSRLGPQFHVDPQMSFETVTGSVRQVVEVAVSPFTVEFFRLSSDPHDQERFRRKLRVPLLGRSTCLPTPEDVIVTKLRWAVYGGRAKDAEDARSVIAVQGDRIDWNFVHLWCGQHGTLQKLDEIRRSIPAI